MGNRDHVPKNPHVTVPVRSPQWSHTANWATWPWVLHDTVNIKGSLSQPRMVLHFCCHTEAPTPTPQFFAGPPVLFYVPHSPQPPRKTQDESCCCTLFSVPYEDTVSQTPPVPCLLSLKREIEPSLYFNWVQADWKSFFKTSAYLPLQYEIRLLH